MTVRISGPSLGPIHTTLWSSRGSGGGRGCAILILPFVLIGLVAAWWHALATSRGFDLFAGGIAAFIGLCALGHLVPRYCIRQYRESFRTGKNAVATVAEINTRTPAIRAKLREHNRAGRWPEMPGWHWTDGDLLERDTEPQAKHSDRR